MREMLRPYRTVSLGDRESLNLLELATTNTDNAGLIIQIYAHGGANGIAANPNGPVISWEQVIQVVSRCRSRFPIRLDLLGVCNSKFIVRDLTATSEIDSIWVTTEQTIWQSVYNNSRLFDSFDQFIIDIQEEPDALDFIRSYREIRR